MQPEHASAAARSNGKMVRMGKPGARRTRHYNSRDERSPRTQGHGPQGHGAAAQGAGPVPAQPGAPPHGRGRVPQAPRGAFGHRARHRLSRPHAVRAGGPPGAPPLRGRQGGLRAERGRAPRPPRLPAMRARRGVLRSRHREAPEQGGPRPWLLDPRPPAAHLRGLHQGELPPPAEGQRVRQTLRPGLEGVFRYRVPESKTVPRIYEEAADFQLMPRVLATGYLVALVEWACIELIKPHLDWPAEQSLGTHVDLSHTAATPAGQSRWGLP